MAQFLKWGLRISIAGLLLLSVIGLIPGPWWLELFVHFRLQYLLALLLLLPLAWKLRDRVCLQAWSLALGFNLMFLAPFYWGGAQGTKDGRVLLCNVLSSNPTPARVVEFLEKEQADVVVLLEVTPSWMPLLEAPMARYPGQIARPRQDNFGMLVLSRQPWDNVRIVDEQVFPLIFAETRLGSKKIHLVAAHPPPPISAEASAIRNLQLQQIKAQAGQATVLMGDLNNTPWSPSLAPIHNSLENSRRGFGLLPSWPSFWPLPMRIPIDHCYVSSEVGVVDCRLGPNLGSDHFGLVVDLRI